MKKKKLYQIYKKNNLIKLKRDECTLVFSFSQLFSVRISFISQIALSMEYFFFLKTTNKFKKEKHICYRQKTQHSCR